MSMRLTDKDIENLRGRGIISDVEVAYKDGLTIVAENLVTKARRVIDVTGLVLEVNQRILLD